MEFGRLVTAMVTPFDENLQVNWDQVKRLVDYLIDEQKTDSLVISGTTGESPTLTDEEKLRLFEVCVAHAKGRCKIIAGTGSYDTAHSVHLTKEAEKLGVDGILLVAPYYNRPSQEGLYQHFKTIAENTNLPVMIYNIPSRTGIHIEAKTTIRLAQVPNIVATKESVSDFDHLSTILANVSSDFKLYSGDDSLTLPMLSIGGYGIVSVASHVIGKEIKAMIQAFIEGNVIEAAQLHTRLYPIFSGIFNCPHRVPSPAPIKYALGLKGINVGRLRLPLLEVDENEAAFIRELF